MDDIVRMEVLNSFLRGVGVRAKLLSSPVTRASRSETRARTSTFLITFAASPSVYFPRLEICSNSSPPDASWNAR